MKNKLLTLNIIFTLLFLIMSALFLIYIFRDMQSRDMQSREYFEADSYSWKYSEGNICDGNLNTNNELRNKNSLFNTMGHNNFHDNTQYTRTILRDTTNKYRKYCDVMNYNDLLAYKCLKKSPKDIYTILQSTEIDIASTIDYIYLYDEQTLYSYILNKIETQKNLLYGPKLIGPVYVCISQSPYLKYKSDFNNSFDYQLDARIDILNNRNPYYYEKISNTGVQSFVTNTNDGSRDSSIISSLYCHILIIYPLYNKKMILKKDTTAEQSVLIEAFLDKTIKPYHTDNGLCFIKCNKSLNLNCGCLTRDASSPKDNLISTIYSSDARSDEIDKPNYTSRCIDHTNKNAIDNFTMMYYVNPYSDNYGDTDIIEDPDPNILIPGISQGLYADVIYKADDPDLDIDIYGIKNMDKSILQALLLPVNK